VLRSLHGTYGPEQTYIQCAKETGVYGDRIIIVTEGHNFSVFIEANSQHFCYITENC